MRTSNVPAAVTSRLSLICNPRSGRVAKSGDAVRRLGRELAGPLYRDVDDVARVGEVLGQLSLTEADTLGVVGGDGTVAAVLTALHAQAPSGPWPTLVHVPGGTTNMTAHDLGVRAPMLDAMRRLGRQERGRVVVRRPAIVVQRPGVPAVCGMFFGVGAVSDGVRFFEQRLRNVGVAGEHNAGFAIARVLLAMLAPGGRAEFPGVEVVSALDGGAEEARPCILVLVSTLDRLVLGMRPYWGVQDAPLHFTRVEQGAERFWRSLPRFARGRPSSSMIPEGGWTSHNARRVTLAFDGPFVLDGETFESGGAVATCTLSASYTPRWLVP